jgi:hypothetical protein
MGLKTSLAGRDNVLVTQSVNWMACVLAIKIDLSATSKTTLHLETAAQKGRPWTLSVRVNGSEIYRQEQSPDSGWVENNLSLEKYLGQQILIEVVNQTSHSRGSPGLFSALTLR